MKIHTVFITHNRLHLTKVAIESYLETVTVPYTVTVIDNGSTDGTLEWLEQKEWPFESFARHCPLGENKYPGFAVNVGWHYAPLNADILHRADNDFSFLPGWCEEVERAFSGRNVGQVGLRTAQEELHCSTNVGGNCVIRRELWDAGLRWDERPWPEFPPGCSEDTFFSPAVRKMGYEWRRVKRPCIVSLASGDWSDPYYQMSYGARGIVPGPDDPMARGVY